MAGGGQGHRPWKHGVACFNNTVGVDGWVMGSAWEWGRGLFVQYQGGG